MHIAAVRYTFTGCNLEKIHHIPSHFYSLRIVHRTRSVTRKNKIIQIQSHADSRKSDHVYLPGWHCQQDSSKSQVTLIH